MRRTLENRTARRATVLPPAPHPSSESEVMLRPPAAGDLELHHSRDVAHVAPRRPPDVVRATAVLRQAGHHPRPATVAPVAVVAMIAAVVFPPAGLPLARMARRECREEGRPGAGLALTASLVASLLTGVIVLVILLLFWGLVSGVNQLADALGIIASFLKVITNLLS